MSEMNGTTIIETTIATVHIAITSLYRHGNFFVQRFVFSKIDILIAPVLSRQRRLNIINILDTPKGLNNCYRIREAA